MYFEIHKHSHFSMFDGFDKINNIVSYAKELGHKAVGLSDHGNASGIIQLYNECKKYDLKPLMGIEAYFQPKFEEGKPKYHLCLYALNTEGYKNLCSLISEANENNFYRTMTVDFQLLEKYNEGILCTSACVAGFVSKALLNDKYEIAMKSANKFKSIFKDNYYIEIQPLYVYDELGVDIQKIINKRMLDLAAKLKIKTIITTDSHFTREEDFDTYLVMHRLGKIGASKGEGFTLEHIEQTYKERYMHSEKDIVKKFKKMLGFEPVEQLKAMDEIYNKIDIELDFSASIPTNDDYADNDKEITKQCQAALKATDRWTEEYIERTKHELSVIKSHGLSDYFLIVADYVKWAKDNDIYVGPGRGSCGGSLVTELLGITEIDPIEVGTDFDRFLRADKKKMPDIDIDFENGGQQQVMEYIIEKYKGRASKIVTFGYYKSLNLINDLCKVYEIDDASDQAHIKQVLQSKVPEMAHFEFEDIDYNEIMRDDRIRQIDRQYKHFVKHFCMLCGQVKYYGQHPAGVIVTSGPIKTWVPLMKIKGQLICSYDKYDCEGMDMVKFDVLALRTLNVIHEIEAMTNDKFDRRHLEEKIQNKMYQNFSEGNTSGIFQLNKEAAKNILKDIQADNIQDIIAAISLNRPGTLKLKTHEQYAGSKMNLDENTVWYPYTKDAYGSIIYQEHVMRICKGLANMEAEKVDKLMKFKFSEDEREGLKQAFIKGAKEHSQVDASVSGPLFDAMALYMFNKGHGAGYALISEWQMYHKVKHPTEFWLASLKWEHDERKKAIFLNEIAGEGIVVFLPHVNYNSNYGLRTIEGEKVIQMGMSEIKGVGEKAADLIEEERKKNGIFTSYDDFYDRCKSRIVTSRVIEKLKEEGALEFDKKTYIKRVTKFNTALYQRSSN